jgi:hypothetical protein
MSICRNLQTLPLLRERNGRRSRLLVIVVDLERSSATGCSQVSPIALVAFPMWAVDVNCNDSSLSACGVCVKKTKGSCQYFLGRNFDGDGTGILLQHPLRVRSVDEDWSAVHDSSLSQISLEKTYYQPTANGVSNPSITIDVARTSPEQTITRGQGCPPPKQSSTISTVTQTGTQEKSQEHNQAGGYYTKGGYYMPVNGTGG